MEGFTSMAKKVQDSVRIDEETERLIKETGMKKAQFYQVAIQNELIRRRSKDVDCLVEWCIRERPVDLVTNLDFVFQIYLRFGKQVPESICLFLSTLFDNDIDVAVVRAFLTNECEKKYEKLIKA